MITCCDVIIIFEHRKFDSEQYRRFILYQKQHTFLYIDDLLHQFIQTVGLICFIYLEHYF